jgi:hypothetical protein
VPINNNILSKLNKKQQDYYLFLAKECLAGFSNAEDSFNIYRYASCNAWLFHSSEFFWKALTILSGNYFERTHEASEADMRKISDDILSNHEKVKIFSILSKFPVIRQELARYGYYEKESLTKSPTADDVFNRNDTKTSLNEVSFLIDKLREIHYYQIFEPPIKIGILSGYVSARNEKPCSYYPHSGYGKAVQWMLDLKNTKNSTRSNSSNGSTLFHASMTSVSDISNGSFSVVINPFGETYPEVGSAEGVGFKTIASYIKDGGIFVNSGGQSFAYSWDVNTGKSQLLVNFIPALSEVIQANYNIKGIPVLEIKESFQVPSESLLLKRQFGLETEWDRPEKNIIGPKEAYIEFDKILGQDIPKTTSRVYRPVRILSQGVIPLVRSYSSDPVWNSNSNDSNDNSNSNIYPVVAVKFGRGFLIHTGMSLDEEREYKILMDIIRRLCLIGYQTLAKS